MRVSHGWRRCASLSHGRPPALRGLRRRRSGGHRRLGQPGRRLERVLRRSVGVARALGQAGAPKSPGPLLPQRAPPARAATMLRAHAQRGRRGRRQRRRGCEGGRRRRRCPPHFCDATGCEPVRSSYKQRFDRRTRAEAAARHGRPFASPRPSRRPCSSEGLRLCRPCSQGESSARRLRKSAHIGAHPWLPPPPRPTVLRRQGAPPSKSVPLGPCGFPRQVILFSRRRVGVERLPRRCSCVWFSVSVCVCCHRLRHLISELHE